MLKRVALKKYAMALSILGLSVALFVYMKATKPQQPAVKPTEKVWLVKTLSVHHQAWRPIYTLYGKVDSQSMVKVSAPISGRIAQLPVRVGDFVEKGQLLVALAESDVKIPLEKAQAQLTQAQAQLAIQEAAEPNQRQKLALEQKILQLKQQAVARTQQLMKKKLASQSALDQAQEALVRQQAVVLAAQLAVEQLAAKRQQLEASVRSAKAAFAQAQVNAQRAQVYAPEAVSIAQVSVAKGDQVTPNQTLLTYYAPSTLEVKAEVPITLYPSFQQQFLQAPPITAMVADRPFQLTLNRFSSQSSTQGVTAYFAFTPQSIQQNQKAKQGKKQKIARIPSPALPGELLTLEVLLAPQPHSFAVPYTALYGNRKIYLVQDGRLQRVSVRLLGDVKVGQERWALLVGSVPEGAHVMVTHLPNALTGLKVKASPASFSTDSSISHKTPAAS